MDEQLKKTCLHELHLGLNAKMSPFAGFDMPIHYGNIVDEHNAVRHKVGMFDVSHMGEISVKGSDAERFINHVFTNDIREMEGGKVLYGMMLYEDGGVVDDLLVYKEFTASTYLLVVNASNIEKDYEWLKSKQTGWNVEIVNESESWGQIAIQGQEAEKYVVEVLNLKQAADLKFYEFCVLEGTLPGSRVILSRTGYTGEDGFEVYASPEDTRNFWQRLLEAGVAPCGLGCRDTLRFEAGLPLYGHELTAEISPVMAGLSMFCKLDKEEFIGKDALQKQKAEGVAAKVVGIELDDVAIPREGYPVELEDGTQVGRVTTGYRSISLDKSICMALVDTAHAALDTNLFVRVRKRVFPGKVIKKRFYQTKYKK